MLSKPLIFIIVALVGSGAVASIVTYNVIYNAPAHQNIAHDSNNSGSNNTENTSNSNKMKILSYRYFFGPDPDNRLRQTTYVHLELSKNLTYNDFIHIHYYDEDLARWWVDRTQAYHKYISVPLNLLTNLNGTLQIEIMRNNKTLYKGSLTFRTNPKIALEIQKVNFRPVNYKYAFINSVNVFVSINNSVYVQDVDITVGNNNTMETFVNKVIGGNDTIKCDAPYNLFAKGNYSINVTINVPLYPTGKIKCAKTMLYDLNFHCINSTISNISVESDSDSTFIEMKINNAYCEDYIELIASDGTVIYNGTDYVSVNGSHNQTYIISFPKHYNIIGNYTLLLKDYFGKILETHKISVSAGPLLLLNHTEDLTYYDWENETYLSEVKLNIKNIGNATAYITSGNMSIFYYSNNTTVTTSNYDWIYYTIKAGESVNITLLVSAYLNTNQTYRFVFSFFGDNTDVTYSFQYIVKT